MSMAAWRQGVRFVVVCDRCERAEEREHPAVKPAMYVRRAATCCGKPMRVRGYLLPGV